VSHLKRLVSRLLTTENSVRSLDSPYDNGACSSPSTSIFPLDFSLYPEMYNGPITAVKVNNNNNNSGHQVIFLLLMFDFTSGKTKELDADYV
jgi:hypothetical protein